MRDTLGESLRKLKWTKQRQKRMSAILMMLSLVVTVDVFWTLRQPGLTLAGDASCGILEHTHDDACGRQICICDLPEEAHVHDAACYETHFVEAQEEIRPICDKTEEPHIHSDSCYETTSVPANTETILICKNEDEAHIHEDACYETTETDGYEETVLICTLISEPHEHTESCFVVEVTEAHEEQILSCGRSETAHTHEDDCYEWELLCDCEEHVHSIECYSDETADVETPLDWQDMFADYPYTGDLRQDLVGIAQTQAGYSESTSNFEVDDDGVRRGYTRYGAWYGAPYRDWSAMFVSFCLNYAGADPEETPFNTGASSMAKAWRNLDKYAPAGEYHPTAGDLVFFTDNTVGIVTEVYHATFYVICGDMEDAVSGAVLSLTDASIAGWGLTEGAVPATETPPDPEPPTEPPNPDNPPVPLSPTNTEDPLESAEPNPPVPEISEEDLLDISNGPAVFIFEGGRTEPQMTRFTVRASRTVTDLIPYLQANNGSYFFTLLDTNNQELPKDTNGNYIVTAGTSYKLTLSITNPDGFLPGIYQYQTPNGLLVNGGTGDFVLKDGINVGSWEVTDEGLITLDFNEHMNTRTDITISATMGIRFPEQDEPFDFDGKISVTIEPPLQPEVSTKLNKWGKQGNEAQGTDPSKLYWTMEITGQKDSNIPGSIITDQISTGDHRYTESDIAAGLRFGAGHYDLETGNQIAWYAWDVSADDPNLTWTETGWTYKMPEVVQSKWYNDPVTLGNDGWIYYIEYSSTPDPTGIAGNYWYTNSATVDGQYAQGWGEFSHGEAQAGIMKTGSFHGDANGGFFLWEFQASIPGMKEGETPVYLWQIQDYMRIKNETNDTVGYIENGVHLATVTATRGVQTVQVPHIDDATTEDDFAWFVEWSADHGDGIYYLKALTPLCRCRCTAETCEFWNHNNYCESQSWRNGRLSGFCRCWTEESDTILTFSYKTDDLSVIDTYGGLKNDLENEVILQNHRYLPDGTLQATTLGDAQAKVPIPGVFKKELTHDFNGYTANYKITVNEAKLALTNGTPLTIHDEMTQTLAYISGSLVITAEDANGNTSTLQQGVDYTVAYDGTGNAIDKTGTPVHVLDIVILRPQPVMYLLDYDATLIIPVGATQAVKYNNSATITLWGQDISDESAEKVYPEINVAAKSYQVELHKKSSLTGEPLGGATFGLFNDRGGLITSDVTDEKGELLFQTNIIEGIVLREHVLYYMQELKAPPGYQLDATKYWFCFCNDMADSCETCNEVMAGTNAFRIPFEQIGKVHAENDLMHYDLPATGGPGIYPLILASVVLILTALVYGFIRRRNQERRGVG